MTAGGGRSPRPLSSKLTEELKSDSAEILRLIATREKSDYDQYLLQLFLERLLDDPIPNEELDSLKSILAKLSSQDLFQIAATRKIPDPLFTPDLFASVKTRLFASETSPAERDELMWGLIYTRRRGGDRGQILLNLFLEVIANQLYSPNRIKFDKLQEMNVQTSREKYIQNKEGWEISGGAVVVRRLLSEICEQLMKEKSESDIKDAERSYSCFVEALEKSNY